ncbi:MAG: PEP-CTERM sorting domain-containing protein [Pirellulales bacterium]|nr:PEP-CTERM sorting domain-containing protein [Pirellulales bacterium]
MRFARLQCLIGLTALSAFFAGSTVLAGGVAVGDSSLIGTLDYSDTFTAYDFGGLEDRDGLGGFNMGIVDYPADGMPGEGLAVESNYGNPLRVWSDWKWSLNLETNALNGVTPFPGPSGAGTDTGMTQSGFSAGVYYDWGIEYGLRDRFVLQWDATQTHDRIDLCAGVERDNIFAAGSVSVFIRPSGNSIYPEVGLYSPLVGEVDTGLASPTQGGQWYNYAALFDLPNRTIEVFVDEVSLGVINVNTVGGGAFVQVEMNNDVVNVGFSSFNTNDDRIWTDNFQVGAVVPEPGTIALLLGGLAALVAVSRKRK